ncbi:hypothetical protein PR202_gb20374 [Eleusine coracana subsp. coracana]|uniref:Clathrin light chain n=1 Tax=Eleusine coracana subsp. coracana TaxID=191504 RepID=A0AAV5F8C9_ELECO|nr:hypothetical protein PR202_gb20374 [Eleusine coracana subsp. coracana]
MDDPVLVDELRPSKPPPVSVYDDMFESYFNRAAEPPEPSPKASSSSSSTPPPVFDKPVFDDDPDTVDPFDAIPLFGGGDGGEDFLGGLGSAEKSEERMEPKAVGFDDDLFPGHGGSARSPVREAADQEAVGFDDLIPGFGGSVKPAPPMEPEEAVFDDGVIPGVGGSTNHHNSARFICIDRVSAVLCTVSRMLTGHVLVSVWLCLSGLRIDYLYINCKPLDLDPLTKGVV